ncbi:WD40 repeat domain-containing protein [Neorhodopirellula pilleata]|uniref:SMP-30/Gluconolaconase/LRE-like region n=1 Tax=Neorhodopirellula pilleata TaxID=2714738 RepID=A0A5C6AHS7_9BACT|nr:hypothetical protein [Neorhodopirellula pilleata]TWT98980.1 hypothetical protein Pla100_21460 [Neorhodopirellula pilleata]
MTGYRLLFILAALSFSGFAKADDLWLAVANEFPGRLRLSEGGTVPRVVFARRDRPDPAYPHAVMKVSQIAVGADGKVYYCSGLDGSLMHLLDGRHEIQASEVAGQIRDLACTGEEHTVYYSVVPTPQNSQPLADGIIYRRDFWAGSPEQVAHIRQADVGGNWWGSFAIRDREIYLATLDQPSRIFKWAGGNLQPVFTDNVHHVTGLAVSPDNHFLFTDGSGGVWETTDFVGVRSVLQTGLPIYDVAVRAASTGGRP